MKVLITGANGQLGRELVEYLSGNNEVLGFGREELDITSLESVFEIVKNESPEVIVHCAAFTAVDDAEQYPDSAYLVNAVGARNVAMAAEQQGSKLIYISTDYVFNGQATNPYCEYDNTDPQGIYGKSKRAGEVNVQTQCRKHFIVRTSWAYGKYGNNFVKTMIRLSKEKENLKVVADQIGSPTCIEDLCEFLSELMKTEKYGIYHASNTGVCSWYEFAHAIFEEIAADISLQPCATSDFPRPAKRPAYSVMEHRMIRINGFKEFRHWRDALSAFLSQNIEEGER
ncbi:dTDP-4-dehydrorhamnose reductase [Paenibacillus gansuensis]|uniref:dTDP-4-dehydrorhamnose reductase n=1 Tax=Paenibacillus gansuensis TaxID=306542 RepID=A0ABW5PGH5_9BACL